MKKWMWVLVVGYYGDVSFQARAASDAYSLSQCYKLAEQKSETLAIQVAGIGQAREHVQQSKAGFLPNLSISAATLKEQPVSNSLVGELYPSTQTTVKATLTQNLFRGLQDLATLRSQESAFTSAQWGKESAKLQLYQDVTQAFYNVLLSEEDLRLYHQERFAQVTRKTEILSLKKSALARESDLVTIESSIANLEALEASARVTLQIARENLRFLLDASIAYRIVDTEVFPSKLLPLEDWQHLLDTRPEVKQGKQDVETAKSALLAAKAVHYPAVDLSADYYFNRPGVLQDVRWDVMLTLSIPLYQGGITESKVREAAFQQSSKEIQLAQISRQLDSTLRALYAGLQEAQTQAQKLQEAVVLATKSYDLLVIDNRQGLATHMDVLNAMNNAYEMQRTFGRLQLSMKNDYLKLRLLAAHIPL